jgi:hypothetical protein
LVVQSRQPTRGAVRTKQNTQPGFGLKLPSAAKITEDYFARCAFISAFLQSHPAIVERVHRDLRKRTRAHRPRARAPCHRLGAGAPSLGTRRCQFHLQQNAQAYIPRISMRPEVAESIRAIFNAPDRPEAERLLSRAVSRY